MRRTIEKKIVFFIDFKVAVLLIRAEILDGTELGSRTSGTLRLYHFYQVVFSQTYS
jgi:hypothetical protein